MIKLGDFGIARRLTETNDLATSQVGTPLYMSPEVAKNEAYNQKTDIWYIIATIHLIIHHRKYNILLLF